MFTIMTINTVVVLFTPCIEREQLQGMRYKTFTWKSIPSKFGEKQWLPKSVLTFQTQRKQKVKC